MNKVDKQYLDLIRDIIENGVEKNTRSGKVKSIFGKTLRFDLKEGFPLLTTKKVFYRGVFVELLWFLSGSTNIKFLVDNKVHIWDDDAYRHYCNIVTENNSIDNSEHKLELLNKDDFIQNVISETKIKYFQNAPKIGITLKSYTFGDLGPIYGYQWRNFGGSGCDQIKKIIETLKSNPYDRRLICVAFNPSDLSEMALPPCHTMFQFYVRKLTLEDRKKYYVYKYQSEQIDDILWKDIPQYGLSCKWSQRSVDTFLGLPFNIASYAALTCMVAEVVGMVPDELIGDLGDTHIYANHNDAIMEQLNRHGYDELPILKFRRKITDIDDFKIDDFIVENYKSDGKITAQLLVG